MDGNPGTHSRGDGAHRKSSLEGSELENVFVLPLVSRAWLLNQRNVIIDEDVFIEKYRGTFFSARCSLFTFETSRGCAGGKAQETYKEQRVSKVLRHLVAA